MYCPCLTSPTTPPPEETGKTFDDNVRLKAESAAKTLNQWVLADDSGLVVPALDGLPGVHSARFSGENSTDKDNREKLLDAMRQLKGEERAAFFQCSLALAAPDGIRKLVHGICEGAIATKEKGSNGFGYDPLFVKHDYSKTFAELDEDTKNRISHRRKAFDLILIVLEGIVSAEAAGSNVST